MQAHDAVAKILKLEGVEYLFCFPANDLIEACAKVDIRPIMTRTERTLINMAHGYSLVSNGKRLGVGCVQGGPGSENAFRRGRACFCGFGAHSHDTGRHFPIGTQHSYRV